MPHDIPFIEIHKLNPRNILKDVPHFNQPRDAVGWQIDLCDIACYDGFGMEA